MISVSRSNIRYSLYKPFFQIIQSITVHELQDDIFVEILLNVDIRGRCDPEGHLLVIRQSARNLLPSYKQNFRKGVSIQESTFFPWTLLLVLTNRKSTNLWHIELKLSVAAIRFQKYDFTHLQSHCITHCDKQVADILWMLLHIGLANPSPLSSIHADFTSFIFRFALNIFDVFTKKKFTPPEMLDAQLLFVFHILQTGIMTPKLLERIIKMIQDDHYSLLPIVFIAAKYNYSIELLLISITSSPEVITRFSFAMVPMYFLTLSNKETPKEITVAVGHFSRQMITSATS